MSRLNEEEDEESPTSDNQFQPQNVPPNNSSCSSAVQYELMPQKVCQGSFVISEAEEEKQRLIEKVKLRLNDDGNGVQRLGQDISKSEEGGDRSPAVFQLAREQVKPKQPDFEMLAPLEKPQLIYSGVGSRGDESSECSLFSQDKSSWPDYGFSMAFNQSNGGQMSIKQQQFSVNKQPAVAANV